MLKQLVIYIMLVLPLSLVAQGLATKLYNRESHQLPDNSVIGSFQDSKGILWVSIYPQYIARFDGVEFTYFDLNNLLEAWSGYSVTRFFEDELGGVWFWASSRDILRWKDGRFTEIKLPWDFNLPVTLRYDKTLQKVFARVLDRDSLRYWTYEDKKENFVLYQIFSLPDTIGIFHAADDDSLTCVIKTLCGKSTSYNCRQYYYLKSGKFIPLPISPLFDNQYIFRIHILPDKRIIAVVTDVMFGENSINEPSLIKLFIFNGKRWTAYSDKWAQKEESYFISGFWSGFIDEKFVLRLDRGDRNKEIIIFEEDSEQFQAYPFYASSELRNNLIKDQNETFWQGTGVGLLRIFPYFQQIQASIFHPKMPSDLFSLEQSKNGTIWLGSYSEGLFYLDQKGFAQKSINPLLKKASQILPGHAMDSQGNMLFVVQDRPLRGILQFDGISEVDTFLNTIPGFCLAIRSDGRILYGSAHKGLFVSKSPILCHEVGCWQCIGANKGLELMHVQAIGIDEKKHIYWMGRASQGIAVYDYEQDKLFNFLKSQESSNIGAITIAVDPWGGTWFGGNEGLYYLNKNAKIDSTFSMVNHIQRKGKFVLDGENSQAQRVRSLKVYQDSLLLISTDRAFAILDLKTFYKKNQQEKYAYFDEKNGYNIGEGVQNGILIGKDEKIWIAGERGTVCFDLTKYQFPTMPFQFSIDSLMIGPEKFYPKAGEHIRGPIGQYTIRVWLSRNGANPLLQNQFFAFGRALKAGSASAEDSTYETQFSGQVMTFNRDPGTYQLTFIATSEGQVSAPINLTVTLRIPLLERTSFWLALFFIIGLIAFLWYIKQQEWKQERNNLRIQAIVNQLNPHFINNALVNLQARAYERGDDFAVEIFAQLGENIRTVFDNAKENRPYHSLKDEMAFVSNFLSIERMRYGDAITYQVPSLVEIEKWEEIKVPLMVIQIHVENAIEHGIGKREPRKGMVKIKIEEKGPYLIIIIEDDGIGPKEAHKKGSHGTQQGQKMLDELIAIYNRKNKFKMSRQTIGEYLTDANGNGYGMQVIIKIPKKYNYDNRKTFNHDDHRRR